VRARAAHAHAVRLRCEGSRAGAGHLGGAGARAQAIAGALRAGHPPGAGEGPHCDGRGAVVGCR
ncbi:hypothetical protein, partial [Bacillus cereus]|uniref:hypothetical protein n=1 Tax=Bacillus cereus TaxID=1396 RepID=UPI0021119426|nr:hypothetical protein [Bacillus cereus]